jgi:two-component system cell cycle response regulator DivK
MADPAISPAVAGTAPVPVRKCILIVEDNPLNMKLFSAMIAAQGYDVLQAGDGVQGLDLARRLHPDLIIMDIQLPHMSGLDVTRNLKTDAATRDIPIIATTAFAMRGDEEMILASGCDAYMSKPIAISQFLELIETFMLKLPDISEFVP